MATLAYHVEVLRDENHLDEMVARLSDLNTARKQIALAGARLARLLNTAFKYMPAAVVMKERSGLPEEFIDVASRSI